MGLSEVLLFVFHGLLGGLLWLCVKWKWDRKSIIQHTIVSAICGYIYYYLHYEYNFPNSIATIIAGYFSVDFIHTICHRFKRFGC